MCRIFKAIIFSSNAFSFFRNEILVGYCSMFLGSIFLCVCKYCFRKKIINDFHKAIHHWKVYHFADDTSIFMQVRR